jgi:hypothetical protein
MIKNFRQDESDSEVTWWQKEGIGLRRESILSLQIHNVGLVFYSQHVCSV